MYLLKSHISGFAMS